MQISKGKIGYFEYGWELFESSKSLPDLQLKIIEQTEQQIRVKISSEEDPDYTLSLNNRRLPKTKFGYNKSGDECVIISQKNNFVKGEWNAVTIYSLDKLDIFPKAYWWGREDDNIFAFLNEIYKSVFYIYIP